MSRESTCRCLICHLERTLSNELASPSFRECYRLFAHSRSWLSSFPSAADLVTFLHTRKTSNGVVDSDGILLELLRTIKTEPHFADLRDLLLLAFIPMLHSTYRQVTRRYRVLSGEDVAQHVVTTLLQIVGRPEVYVRGSYVAFTISRILKRTTFEWAARETRSALPSQFEATSLGSVSGCHTAVPFERTVLLRHFLSRCLAHGMLTSEELNLLVQFKLDATRDKFRGDPAVIYSNATRQRMKRLVSKLRRIAQEPTDIAQLRLF